MTDVDEKQTHTFVCDFRDCEEYVAVSVPPQSSHLLRVYLMRDHGWLSTSDNVGVIEDLCPVHADNFAEWTRRDRGNVPISLRATHSVTGRFALEINSYTIVCCQVECPSKMYGTRGESIRATLDRLKRMGWWSRSYGEAKTKFVALCPDHLNSFPAIPRHR